MYMYMYICNYIYGCLALLKRSVHYDTIRKNTKMAYETNLWMWRSGITLEDDKQTCSDH